jgi:hypothetical protein
MSLAVSGPGGKPQTHTRFALIWCAALFIAATVPHLLATLAPPPGRDGFGTIMFVNDFAQYEAAMSEGAQSPSWLVHDHFSPEAHEPALMFPLYVGIGKLASAAGIPALAVYRLIEALGRLAVLGCISWLALSFVPRGGRLAVVLGTVGAGLGVWAALVQAAFGVPQPYGGNGSYELNNYALLFAPPHVTFGMAITLGIVALLVRAEIAWSWKHALGLTLATVALCLLHPFNVVTLGVIAGALALATLADPPGTSRLSPLGARSAGAMVLLGVAAAPFVLYNAATFAADPFWGRAYGAQNVLPSPALHELVIDLGVLLLVGIPALVWLWRQGSSGRRLALAVGLMLLLMYAPVPFQRRFAFGIAPLLGMVVGAALAVWLSRCGATARGPHLAIAALLAAALGSPLVVYGGFVASSRLDAPIAVYRASTDLQQARAWIAANTTSHDVLLASWDVANYLAGAAPGRIVGGHPVATLGAAERRAQAATIFSAPDDQEAVVRREGATLLVSTGAAEPILVSGADPVFTRGEVTVARLAPASLAAAEPVPASNR